MITLFLFLRRSSDREVDAASAIDLTASKSHLLEGNIGDICHFQGKFDNAYPNQEEEHI